MGASFLTFDTSLLSPTGGSRFRNMPSRGSSSRFGSGDESRIGHWVRRIVYSPLRLVELLPIIRSLRGGALKKLPNTGLALFERTQGLHGGSIEAGIRIVKRRLKGPPASVLVVGCGDGREVQHWHESSLAVGQDVLDFSKEWISLQTEGRSFVRCQIEHLAFRDEAFDSVSANAVFEHLPRFDQCAAEINRVLRPRGTISASFAPLWFTYEGAHDGFADYQHLFKTGQELIETVRPGSQAELFLRHDMFSKLRVEDYRSILSRHFEIERWAIGLSSKGLKFKRKSPEVWSALRTRCEEADLLAWGIYFLGVKRD